MGKNSDDQAGEENMNTATARQIQPEHLRLLPGIQRRASERYHFQETEVPARIFAAKTKQVFSGLVRNASRTGMLVETSDPLPFRSQVKVEITLRSGETAQSFSGRVARASSGEMAILFNVEDGSLGFRTSFLEQGQTADLTPPTVRIVQQGSAEADVITLDRDNRDLGASWLKVLESPKDDETHQSFIADCVRRKRVEYALERYRELKEQENADVELNRYLTQIGTILSFSALKPKETTGRGRRRKWGVLAFLLILFVGILIGVPTSVRHLVGGARDQAAKSVGKYENNQAPKN